MHIQLRIGEFDKSTFGTIQTYYEDAYLKIIEARLLSNRDLIMCLSKIKQAIGIYNRVKHILRERIENAEIKSDLGQEEQTTVEREEELYEKSEKALTATIKLKDEIESILVELAEQGIEEKNLIKIAELTSEYNVDLYEILLDTFGQSKKTKDRLKSILKRVEKIFNEYEKWKNIHFAVF